MVALAIEKTPSKFQNARTAFYDHLYASHFELLYS